MGEIVEISKNLPAEMRDVFNPDALAGDLYDGVASGFSVVSFRGSKWRIKHNGEEELLTRDVDGEEVPIPSLEVVLIKASRNISKIYYEGNYSEGDDSPPACFSVDGIRPDVQSANPQAETCAVCKQNVWGSKISPAGKKIKACSDTRRVAVVPLGDIKNERYNGPMLLRIPAASLSDLASYGKGMAAKGFPYNAIGTRIGFDTTASYPKLTFKPIRKLTDEELLEVAEVSKSETVSSILNVAVEPGVPTTKEAPVVQEAVSFDFEEEEEAKVEEKPKKTVRKKVAKKAAKKAEPVDDLDDSLDSVLEELDSLG